MKQAMKGLFSIALLFSTVAKADINGRSFFLGSNVGNVTGAGLLEQAGKTHRFDADKMYGCFSIHGEYNGSFKSGDLGKYLSPIANKTFRLGQEDTATANAATDVYSGFFLLNDAYTANITFKPTSKTFTTDLNLFVGLDEFMEGMYFNVELPIVHNKRQVKITEAQVTAADDGNINTGFFAAGATTTVAYTTFKSAMVGNLTTGAGVAANNMNYGKINGSQSKTKVGNVRLNLGYDFVRKENMHLGVALEALVNGNGKSKAVYMFEPSVGTGGRHGIGGRIDGHVRAWEKDDSEINLFLQADLVHLFDATELRSYDLTANGTWSRYLLFKEWLSANLNDAGNPETTAIVHGVNFTTLNAKIGMDLMYDVNLMMSYSNSSMGINVGYGLHGHSKEEHKKWVDAFTTKYYGAWSPDDADMDTAVNHLLSTNIKIDGGNGSSAAVTTATAVTTNTVVLADLDKNSGLQPSSMVHNVFGDVNYKWEDHEWEPCLGVGGSAAISSNNKGLSQWGVFFHGGICF